MGKVAKCLINEFNIPFLKNFYAPISTEKNINFDMIKVIDF